MSNTLNADLMWRGGPAWAALWFGLPAGVIFGALQFAESGSVGKAIFGAVFFGVFFGPVFALFMWKAWPGAKQLRSEDRMAVARAIRLGQDIGEPELAPAVLEHAAVHRQALDRDRRYSWVFLFFLGLTLILAVSGTVGGSVRTTVFWWALVIYWVLFLLWLPRRRARKEANVERAEMFARRMMER